ncbi:uncharacterized protein LOC133180604 [Saccostrea echinata]|uniref:uncharacterized protein LOC133180604 n=1 Tax=Saccostrea echinata TaxID=191078 RepID=UPI002A8282A6|nr:uncharacterized protein LOC133180604 [Saccostrea echinata]
MKQRVLDLQKTLEFNDLSLTQSRNEEFRRLPPEVNVSLPVFSPQKINTKQLNQLFGSLSELSMKTKHGYTMETPEAVSSPPVKPLLNEPELITTITTKHDDIAVTKSGDLIYTDYKRGSVNKVRKRQIVELIRLQGWKPSNVYSTFAGDLLIIMDSDDGEQSKLARYTGQIERETFQFVNTVKPLYSSGYFTKYISENRNLDICVADFLAKAVVVVNQAGNLRFRYTGHSSTTKTFFEPVGVTTDSQSQILTSDCFNSCIHIFDQDGQFLSYIENCELFRPWGLCVNTKDHLFVAESDSKKVKQIKYM